MSMVVCCCVWSWTGVLYQSNKEVSYTYAVYVVVNTCLVFCVVICRYSCVCVGVLYGCICVLMLGGTLGSFPKEHNCMSVGVCPCVYGI